MSSGLVGICFQMLFALINNDTVRNAKDSNKNNSEKRRKNTFENKKND